MVTAPSALDEKTLADSVLVGLESACTLAEDAGTAAAVGIDVQAPVLRGLISAARELASQRDAFAELLLIHEVLMPHKREGESYLQAAARLDREHRDLKGAVEAEREGCVATCIEVAYSASIDGWPDIQVGAMRCHDAIRSRGKADR